MDTVAELKLGRDVERVQHSVDLGFSEMKGLFGLLQQKIDAVTQTVAENQRATEKEFATRDKALAAALETRDKIDADHEERLRAVADLPRRVGDVEERTDRLEGATQRLLLKMAATSGAVGVVIVVAEWLVQSTLSHR